MSATPRPWRLDIRGAPASDRDPGNFEQVQGILGADDAAGDHPIVETDSGFYGPGPDDARLIVRAVNAFDALLAVAKAVQEMHRAPRLADAMSALDAQHPGWREWA